MLHSVNVSLQVEKEKLGSYHTYPTVLSCPTQQLYITYYIFFLNLTFVTYYNVLKLFISKIFSYLLIGYRLCLISVSIKVRGRLNPRVHYHQGQQFISTFQHQNFLWLLYYRNLKQVVLCFTLYL